MAGIRGLRYIQLSKETTAGTVAAATAIWRGTGTLKDERKVTFPEEDVAYLSGTDRSYIGEIGASISFDDTPLTFEQAPYILNAGIKGVSGVQDGTSGSGYAYTYTAPVTSLNTVYSYTIEGGDNQQGEVMEYGTVTGLKISGKPKGALMISADWIGRQVAKQAKTASLSLVTVEEALFGKTKLYLDAVSGTIGTTQAAATLIGFDFNATTGWVPDFLSDNLYFTAPVFDYTAQEYTLDVTFVHNSSAVSEKDNWRNQTPRLLRLETAGAALTTTGTYETKLFRIDLAGKWESFDKLDEDNGNDVVKGTFRARHNATASKFVELVVVNETDTLP